MRTASVGGVTCREDERGVEAASREDRSGGVLPGDCVRRSSGVFISAAAAETGGARLRGVASC